MHKLGLKCIRKIWLDTEFVAIDFETTGLNCRSDRIIEVGAVRFNSIEELEVLDFLVDPGIPISSAASMVNGITNDHVKGKKPCDDAVQIILDFMGKSITVAHNVSFDIGFLMAAMKRVNIDNFKNRLVDTVLIAREAFPGLPSYSLQRLARTLGIETPRAHRALDDARLCKEIFLKAIKKDDE